MGVAELAILLGSLAGIVTSLIILYNKLLRPAYHAMKKTGQVLDVVLDLPDWCESIDRSLAECKEELAAVKDQVKNMDPQYTDEVDRGN